VDRWCIFCRIIAHQEPADILYEDDEVIVFRNVLRWVPVMLLAVPKEHLTQDEVWATKMDKLAPIAARLGAQHCPSGFRLLSNFGFDAMQSQAHGHIHVIGGTYLGHYA
jgi:histidine triad (HIT) family protein